MFLPNQRSTTFILELLERQGIMSYANGKHTYKNINHLHCQYTPNTKKYFFQNELVNLVANLSMLIISNRWITMLIIFWQLGVILFVLYRAHDIHNNEAMIAYNAD